MLKLLFVGFATIDVYEDEALLSGAAASMACNASLLGLSASLMCPLSTSKDGLKWTQKFLDTRVNTDLCTETQELPRCVISDRFGLGTTRNWKGDAAIAALRAAVFSKELLLKNEFSAVVTANAHPIQVAFIRDSFLGRAFYIPGPQIVSNPSYLDLNFMKVTSAIFANEEEAPVVLRLTSEAAISATVIATLGKRGCQVVRDGQLLFKFEAPTIDNPIDATGAGDCFALGYIIATLNGANIPESVDFGQKLAKRIIQKVGTLLEGEGSAEF